MSATTRQVEIAVSTVRSQRLQGVEALAGVDPERKLPCSKLTIEQESAIRALAGIRSLSSWTSDFSVSHETIRAEFRQVSAV